MTNREFIAKLRKKIQEMDADSSYYDSFLYQSGEDMASWIIKREDSANKIYPSMQLFTPLNCVDIIETPETECCGVAYSCKKYRTKVKLPDIWEGNKGPIIKNIVSIGNVKFLLTTETSFIEISRNPYIKNNKEKYAIYENGYLYLSDNPQKITVFAYWKEDVKKYETCEETKNVMKKDDRCRRFLDEDFTAPKWTHAEIISKTVDEILGRTKQSPTDEKINKNELR